MSLWWNPLRFVLSIRSVTKIRGRFVPKMLFTCHFLKKFLGVTSDFKIISFSVNWGYLSAFIKNLNFSIRRNIFTRTKNCIWAKISRKLSLSKHQYFTPWFHWIAHILNSFKHWQHFFMLWSKELNLLLQNLSIRMIY